jgi:hypothetical protein
MLELWEKTRIISRSTLRKKDNQPLSISKLYISKASPLSLSAFSASSVQSLNLLASKVQLSSSNGTFMDSTPLEAALCFRSKVFTAVRSEF